MCHENGMCAETMNMMLHSLSVVAHVTAFSQVVFCAISFDHWATSVNRTDWFIACFNSVVMRALSKQCAP